MGHADDPATLARPPAEPVPQVRVSGNALALHADTLLISAHTSAEVLRERCASAYLAGGVNAAIVTFALEDSWDQVLRNFERHLALIQSNPLLALCLTAADIKSSQRRGKLGVVIATQGANMIQDAGQLWRLDTLVRLGLRVLGLTHNSANALGDGCGELRDAGLSYLGEELIERVNTLPLMLDLSHCGHRTRAEAAAMARAPVCTHSNSEAVRNNDRNTRDPTVRALAAKGGVIGICNAPHTLSRDGKAALDDLLDHVDHLVRLVGADHVGIGLDFAEGSPAEDARAASQLWRARRPDIFGAPQAAGRAQRRVGMKSVRQLPRLIQGLLDRGYPVEQIRALLGGSWLSAFRRFCG